MYLLQQTGRAHLPVHPGSRPRTGMLPCSPTMYRKHMRSPCFTKFRPQTQVNSSHPSKLLRSSPGRCASTPVQVEGARGREVTHPVHVCPPPRLPPLRDELPESPPPRDSSMLRRDCCPVPRSLMANRKGSSSSKVLAGRVNLPPR